MSCTRSNWIACVTNAFHYREFMLYRLQMMVFSSNEIYFDKFYNSWKKWLYAPLLDATHLASAFDPILLKKTRNPVSPLALRTSEFCNGCEQTSGNVHRVVFLTFFIFEFLYYILQRMWAYTHQHSLAVFWDEMQKMHSLH